MRKFRELSFNPNALLVLQEASPLHLYYVWLWGSYCSITNVVLNVDHHQQQFQSVFMLLTLLLSLCERTLN